jgi:hypothetical protein
LVVLGDCCQYFADDDDRHDQITRDATGGDQISNWNADLLNSLEANVLDTRPVDCRYGRTFRIADTAFAYQLSATPDSIII